MHDDAILTKSQRLARLSHLLYRHPHGLTSRELARLCGVGQRTIQRDLQDFDDLDIPLWQSEDHPHRYGILSGYYIPPIHLNLPEAASLYLAGRLLVRNCDHFDAHTTAALAKLANVLPDPMSNHMQATIARLATRAADRDYEHILSTLVTGWATRRVVRLRYLSAAAEQERETDLSPYCIEASGVVDGIYVIGYASHARALRTYKLDRVQTATLTADTFEPPEDFDGPQLLGSCWGIMYGDEREHVVLRFLPSAMRRVGETDWHSSQRIVALPDGGCQLHLDIAHPEEMIYWIRGWGPQVQVLAPDWLRERMAAEASATAALYEEATP